MRWKRSLHLPSVSMSKLPFGFDKPEDSPGFLLWQTTVAWQKLIKKALEPFAIPHAQFVIMAILLWLEEHDYDTTQMLIAKWSKLDKMTVSKSLKKLVVQGLVKRTEHKTDTRAKSVKLSVKGKTLIYKLIPIVEKVDADFFGKAMSEQQKLIHILGKLAN